MTRSESEETARALERVLLRSLDLRHALAELRELTTPAQGTPPHRANELWEEAERLVAELEELGRAGQVPESPEKPRGS